MAKYSNAMVQAAEQWVAEHGLMEFGGAQLQDFIAMLGVDDKTYRRWLLRHTPFREAIERGKAVFKHNLTHQLHTSLAQAAKGFEHEEVEQLFRVGADGQPTPHQMRRTRKYYKPDIGAAIFLLTNLDPEHYQNRQRADIAVKPAEEDREMTIEEINAEIERLEKLDEP